MAVDLTLNKSLKVLLVNGSTRQNGCTNAALTEVARGLTESGVSSEIYFIPNEPMADCLGCGRCSELGRCVIETDAVNNFVAKACKFDGFVFGSPVYYSHPTGKLQTFMDRVFFSGKSAFEFKPAAAVFSARRAGSPASMDVINKYFTISSMPVVSANYWNHVFGSNAEQVAQDKEGLVTMYNIGLNMAWLLKCIEFARENGLDHPVNGKDYTNFIR